PAQARAYRLADNKTAELADWDQDRLVQELTDLQRLEVDLDVLGFGSAEFDALLAAEGGAGPVDPDLIPEPPDEPLTQPGALCLLGRLGRVGGDPAALGTVDRLLAAATVHLVNSDPPYNVRVEPRSNPARAAGLSSFEALSPPKLACPGHRAPPTPRKLRA